MIEALHLFANHKVTGPAELALETARWIPIVDPGLRCPFYSSAIPKPSENKDRWLQQLARERGVPEPPFSDILLGKHFSPFSALRDALKLRRHLKAAPPEIIHTHSPNDHLLAALACRGAAAPLILRTVYDGEAPKNKARARFALARAERIICLSESVAEHLRTGPYGLDSAAVLHMPPPIDTERFDPRRPDIPELRARLDIAADAPVYGIVARMQTHRRFEVLIEAIARVAKARPEARAIIVGRGTNQQAVARDPIAQQGLSEFVRFSGYLKGEDYVGVLKAMDLKVFLVPGSDGTCRAVREALAMGVPVIAARRGMLPEIVRHERSGLVIEDEPEALAAAILGLLGDDGRRAAYAQGAREDAEQRFAFRTYAGRLARLYRELTDSSELSSPAKS